MSIDQLSEIKKKVDTISQHLTTETQGKDLSKEKFDTINTELWKAKIELAEFWKTNLEYLHDKATLEQIKTIESKITQIETVLLKFNKELMVLQGSVQKSAIPPVEAEFANFLANNNGMDPKAKQQRVQAAKHIIEENIPGMDRLLS